MLLRSTLLEAVPGVGHGFSTCVADGGADFDLGPADSVDPVHRERIDRFARVLGLAPAPVLPRQVHGCAMVRARAGTAPEADAVFGDGQAGPAVGVRTADCIPVLIAARDGRWVAAVHAGWRGTAAGIAATCVARLAREGQGPAGWVAAIGPGAGPCCYEVGPEVRSALGAAPGRGTVDLAELNRRQLVEAGLSPEAIDVAGRCTICEPQWFHSHRRDGALAGRAVALVGCRQAALTAVVP